MHYLSDLWHAADRPRHRLGTAGLVHCVEHPEVAATFAALRRPWLLALLVPARHGQAARRRNVVARRPILAPAT